MKILFVCKHNRFRSKVAEAYFKKVNKNKNIKAESAGIFVGYGPARNVLRIGKKLDLKLTKKTKGLMDTDFWNKKFDLLVIVANNVPKSLFKGKIEKIIVWKIKDTSARDVKGIERIMKEIFKKVDKLVKRLENKTL